MEENILKKKNKKSKFIKSQTLTIFLALILLLGVSYAFFEFTRAGEEELITVAGNIYMDMVSESMNNDRKLYPMNSTNGMVNGAKYNFTIKGFNDSESTIYYGVYISRGPDVDGMNRLKDSDMMMVLYETIDGEKRKVYGPGSLEEFNKTLIYANSIEGNMGDSEVLSYQYELVVWVSEKVVISNNATKFEGKSVYTPEYFGNAYNNIRIIVEGDFEERNTVNNEVTINAYTKSDNVTYITNLSYENTPYVSDDVIVNFTINKEPTKLVIVNEKTNSKVEVVPTKTDNTWNYQYETSVSGTYTYYIEYKDGTNSDVYHFNVRIDKEDPVFNLSVGGRYKANGYNKTVSITNAITNISEDIVTLKYAIVKKGEVVDKYLNIANFGISYALHETLNTGIYELHILAIDEAGKEYLSHVTYEVSYDLLILNNIDDQTTSIEVLPSKTFDYIESLPEILNIYIDGYGFGKYSLDIVGNDVITNTDIVSYNLDKIYAIFLPILYDVVETDLSSYLLADDGDARILSGGGGYNAGNPIPDPDFKNYVWYSGKLWRIVALNNDGSIKLVTQDNITTIQWGAEPATFYSDDGEGNVTKSWMYEWLNEDFLDTLYNKEKIVKLDSEWDVTMTEETTKPTNPTKITASVGLLTAYEYTKSYTKTVSYVAGYLNNGYYWWLLTPYSSSSVRCVLYYGGLSNFSPRSVSYSNGARPSINLSSNIKTSGGDGSLENPYTIEGDISSPSYNVTKLNERVSGEYVNFNGGLYQIVSIENDITKIMQVDYLKSDTTIITKSFSSGSIKYGSGTSSDYWDYYLNNDWYNSISTSPINYKGMIVKGDWYLGMYPDNTSYKATICTEATITQPIKNCTKLTGTDDYGPLVYNGYVGLGRVGEMFVSMLGEGYKDITIRHWSITPYSSDYIDVVSDWGNLAPGYGDPESNSYGVRPSMFLSSNVVITSGLGTKDAPFEINFAS